jgi:uncharacterized membrane protein SpoIIM required for sporulation
MFWADYSVLWWFIIGQAIITALLVRTGIAHFNREELLGRELDNIDLRWAWRVFVETFKGGAHSPKEWYRGVLKGTFKGVRLPLGLTTLLLAIGFGIGMAFADVYALPAGTLNLDNLQNGVSTNIQGFGAIQFFTVGGVFTIWMHNIRTILLATLFGLFSFGVLGVLLMILPFALIGYFTATIAHLGISPWLFLTATVLPHGILEIPAILLAGAIILKLGASLSTPAPGYSISEALMRALGDWARILVALVIPIFLGAAILEIFITPQIVILLLGS